MNKWKYSKIWKFYKCITYVTESYQIVKKLEIVTWKKIHIAFMQSVIIYYSDSWLWLTARWDPVQNLHLGYFFSGYPESPRFGFMVQLLLLHSFMTISLISKHSSLLFWHPKLTFFPNFLFWEMTKSLFVFSRNGTSNLSLTDGLSSAPSQESATKSF